MGTTMNIRKPMVNGRLNTTPAVLSLCKKRLRPSPLLFFICIPPFTGNHCLIKTGQSFLCPIKHFFRYLFCAHNIVGTVIELFCGSGSVISTVAQLFLNLV